MSIMHLPTTHPLHRCRVWPASDPIPASQPSPVVLGVMGRTAYHVLWADNAAPYPRLDAAERATWRAHGEALAAIDADWRWTWESLPPDPDPEPTPISMPVPVICEESEWAA